MKQINDKHGHPAGDAALRHIATVLRNNMRSSDIVGRLGGDEFGVILAQTNQEQAHAKAAALAEAIGSQRRCAGASMPSRSAPPTASMRFAGSDDAQHAIEAADKAMYQQKRASPRAA